jgi:uncharacterized membrane protein
LFASGSAPSYRSVIAILVCAIVVVGVVTYVTSANYFASSNKGPPHIPPSLVIVKANVTVVGQAAGIPCSALRLPCPLPTNQSTISAVLIEYRGTYYYVSYLSVNDIHYAVWYDNSTYYCVTPRVGWANTCPT